MEEYHQNLQEIKRNKVAVTALFKDEEMLSQINKSASRASDYYYEMQHLIEDLEYKYATFIKRVPKRKSVKSRK